MENTVDQKEFKVHCSIWIEIGNYICNIILTLHTISEDKVQNSSSNSKIFIVNFIGIIY